MSPQESLGGALGLYMRFMALTPFGAHGVGVAALVRYLMPVFWVIAGVIGIVRTLPARRLVSQALKDIKISSRLAPEL